MTSSGQPMTDEVGSAIGRTVEVGSKEVGNVDEYFEINRTAKWINENHYRRVALQCPDELLGFSSQIVDKLRGRCPEATISILADTSYASCCVDDITAEHCAADCIVHYGHACLSPAFRYPVLYVYGQDPLDIEDFRFKFRQEFGRDKVVVFYAVEYAYIIAPLRISLNNPNVVFTGLVDPSHSPPAPRQPQPDPSQSPINPSRSPLNPSQLTPHLSPSSPHSSQSSLDAPADCCSRHVPIENGDLPNYKALYIGTHESSLSNLVLSLSQCQFYSYNPHSKNMQKETSNVNRTLMKRYTLVERTKDARIVGIIAGASGHRDYQMIVKRLKQVLRTAGKKYYTFLVGKLNVPKLANFMEIDVYVLVACQENAMLESREFYRPVVTPLEVELACNPQREWSPTYTADFSQLLPSGSMYVPMPDKMELTTDVSLITGQIRTLGTDDDVTEGQSDVTGTVAERNRKTAVTTIGSAGDFLSSRTWSGLEQKLGQTPVSLASEGQTGIARLYRDAATHDKLTDKLDENNT